jgi:EAL domain-containing protein (putative c-di-GMP-specific phosphodiesterase class I)
MGTGLFRRLRQQLKDGRTKVLLWTTLVALLFGLIDLGEPLEYALRISRDRLREQAPSGEIVLVAIDDRNFEGHERSPWGTRRNHAQLIEALAAAGARSVTYAIDLPTAASARDRAALVEAVHRHAELVNFTASFSIDPSTGKRTARFTDPALQRPDRQVNVNFHYNFTGIAWRLPFAVEMEGRQLPSLAASVAGVRGGIWDTYRIDYAIDISKIERLRAIDVLGGAAGQALRGRDVVVADTSPTTSNQMFIPGRGLLPTIYIHLAGAETLKNGRPMEIGWLAPLACALAISILSTSRRRGKLGGVLSFLGIVALLAGPVALERLSIFMEVTPALFLLCIVSLFIGSGSLWKAYRQRANMNAVSGLPNLNALRLEDEVSDRTLVVARVRNYAEICTALSAGQEQELAKEIARRLSVGAPIPKLFHGDEGTFAWFAAPESDARLQEHLEALHALFRTPIVVGNAPFDLALTFGIEATPGRSVANRLGSALVAADQAAASGSIWDKYDPERLKEAPWRLSILSQLDAAAETGDLWVAYQPKLDLTTRRIVGAEALVRWTHPEKGAVSPLEFIPVAEQSGRISGLTTFVLERAIRAAAFIHKRDATFGVSVNLSAKLLDEIGLDETIVRILHQYRLPPNRLTLEVTETAALASGGSDLEALGRLRDMGVLVSIDDYGTGLSTLEYLRKIPATEIKIDQSFVQAIYKNHSDKLMVHSTIQLAHSLGQKVVAEGVEDAQTLEALAFMGCDEAQGYFIGKPVPFRDLVRNLRARRPTQRAQPWLTAC